MHVFCSDVCCSAVANTPRGRAGAWDWLTSIPPSRTRDAMPYVCHLHHAHDPWSSRHHIQRHDPRSSSYYGLNKSVDKRSRDTDAARLTECVMTVALYVGSGQLCAFSRCRTYGLRAMRLLCAENAAIFSCSQILYHHWVISQ